MAYYVYLFTFPNGKHYVGRTNNYENRLISHKHSAKKKKKFTLYFAINKYGWDNVDKKVIDVVDTLEESIVKEFERIVEYDSVKNGYNSTFNTKDGGSIWIDRQDSEEYLSFVEYMKDITKGENNGMYGKKHSSETRDLLKQKAKGRFSLSWYLEKYGESGKEMYEKRRLFLKSRNMNRSSNGRFNKKSQS